MMYLLLMRQPGQGCDYTIGCAQKWQLFSSTPETVFVEAKQMVRDHGWGGRDPRVSEAYVIPAEGLVNLAPMLNAEDEAERERVAQQEHQQKETDERAAYERLKQKFEGR